MYLDKQYGCKSFFQRAMKLGASLSGVHYDGSGSPQTFETAIAEWHIKAAVARNG